MRSIGFVVVAILLVLDPFSQIRAQEKITTLKQISKYGLDLNSDGQNDFINFACYAQLGDFGYDRYVLEVHTSIIAGRGLSLEGIFHIVDIDSTDNYMEIEIPEAGASDDYAAHFYYYTGESIAFMGTIPDGGTPGTGKLYMDGSGIVHTWRRGAILHTWFYPAEYRLDESHQLVFVKHDFYPMNYPVVMKTELPLQTLPSDTTTVTVLQPGEHVVIVGSDDEKWCLVEAADGRQGWFAVERFGTIVCIGKGAWEVFEGLNMAD